MGEPLIENGSRLSNAVVMAPEPPPTPQNDPTETVSSYWEGEKLVLCDRTNPRAWIKSDVTVAVDRSETKNEREAPEPEGEKRS